MLAKSAWRLVNNSNPVVTNLMKATYYPDTDFLHVTMGANLSYIWRSILEAHGVVRQGARKRIGDGNSTRGWKVPWLPCQENGYLTTEMPTQLEHITVSNLLDEEQMGWDDEILQDICNERDINLIKQIPIPMRKKEDTWFWLLDGTGTFTVKSCYRKIQREIECPDRSFWKKVWSLKLPGKVSNFI